MNFTKEEHREFAKAWFRLSKSKTSIERDLARDCVTLQRKVDELEEKIHFLEFDGQSANFTLA